MISLIGCMIRTYRTLICLVVTINTAGEVAGILQKKYQGHEVNLEHMEKELGDCLWMIAEACNALGTDIDTVMQMNIDKLKARYPEGFTVENSLHRKPGDI